MSKPQAIVNFFRRQPYWKLAVVVVLLLGAGIWFATSGGKTSSNTPTFVARRGPLDITVLEGGSLQALESQEVKCRVRVGHQGTKILKIVEEGYLVTEEDVKSGKVLVELDSSDIEQQIITQEIQYQSALANMIDAEQNYEIQLRQNRSDVLAAEQKVRFARMDFDKFLGEDVTSKVVDECGLQALLVAAYTNDVEEPRSVAPPVQPMQPKPAPPVLTNGPATIVPAVMRTISDTSPAPIGPRVSGSDRPAMRSAPPESAPVSDEPNLPSIELAKVDFSKYADISILGDGEAKQKLRKFEDDLQVSRKELGQSSSTLEGTKRLIEKGFVTRNDLQRDEIAYENCRLKVQTAETAQDLFLKYDFLKLAEESLSKYADAVRDMDKARRVAVSKQAQARARLRSAQGQHEVQSRQRRDLQEQLKNCIITAEKPGLVVYGGGREDYFGSEERIREGATLRERQSIITIPDMSRMSVNVKVHESYIKKVMKGQKARITVDAFPDKVLTGEITKVAVLPDSQNRWMNPDMKIYNTTVTIEGSHEWAKPGMSAKVEILVSQIPECVYVPVQTISSVGQKQVCYVMQGSRPEMRQVTIGEFNDDFIEIRSGLKEGERVCLRPPSGIETGGEKPADPGSKQKPEAPKEPAVTQTAKT